MDRPAIAVLVSKNRRLSCMAVQKAACFLLLPRSEKSKNTLHHTTDGEHPELGVSIGGIVLLL